jgi:[ribosomal protein S5]-alanine N-acetyltransferase
MRIESTRLSLMPLSLNELQLLIKGRNFLDESIGLTMSDFEISAGKSFMEEFIVAMDSFVIPKVMENQQDYEWFTHWIIIENKLNLNIGGIGCAGMPDENGQAMIGYYIDKKFEGMGYATEALNCFMNHLFKNESLKSIVADTLIENIASQKVLEKNNFLFECETEEGLRWKRNREFFFD